MNKISIIIPVYNVAPYIRECLHSVQHQTHSDIEVILVNDGSTDSSGAICDEYASEDARFIVVHKENGGVSSARNAGLDLATGEYIGFIDPDDYVTVDFYEKLLTAAVEHDADFALAPNARISEAGDLLSDNSLVEAFFSSRNPHLTVQESKEDVLFLIMFQVNAWDKLYKRELWDGCRFPLDLSLGEDGAICPIVCARANRSVYVPDVTYWYRVREKSLSHGDITLQRFHQNLRGTAAAAHHLLEHYPEEARNVITHKLAIDTLNYVSFRTSSKETEESESKKGSFLFRLVSHIKDA